MKKLLVAIIISIVISFCLSAQPVLYAPVGGNGNGSISKFVAGSNSLTSVHTFEDNGQNPYYSSLIEGPDGKYYGNFPQGGKYGYGFLYSYDPNSHLFTKIKELNMSDGYYPYAGMTKGPDGKLYGVTEGGGNNYDGVIYSYDPATNEFNKKRELSYTDGGNNQAELLLASDGNFYGKSNSGGSNGHGTIFRFNPSTSTYSVLYNFIGTDYQSSYGAMTEGLNGKLYGITESGGANNTGYIYSFDLAINSYQVLFSFSALPSSGAQINSTGANSYGKLVSAPNGKFYGTTYYGGSNGTGVIFSFDPSTNSYSVVRSFAYPDGYFPAGDMTLGNDGKLYGLTNSGGTLNGGVLFSFDPATSNYQNQKEFAFGSVSSPNNSSLFKLANGQLIGTLAQGGNNSAGILFSFNPIGSILTNIYNFGNIGGLTPYGSLAKVNGKYYGVTYSGGTSNAGVIYSYDPVSSQYIKLKDLDNNSGSYPFSGMVSGTDGKLYGTTSSGGTDGLGVIYSFDPITFQYSKLIDMQYSSGANPLGGLFLASNGKFYGMAYYGGDFGYGVIFSFDPTSSVYVKLKDFNYTDGGYANNNRFIEGADGKLYGLTSSGGNFADGVLFSFDPSSTTYTKLKDFDYNITGAYPYGSLIRAIDNKLYGTTGNNGYIFSFDPNTNNFNLLSQSSAWTNNIFLASNGKMYGLNNSEGLYSDGSVFSFDPIDNSNIQLSSFNYDNGSRPSNNSFIEEGSCNSLPQVTIATNSPVANPICEGTTLTLNASGGNFYYWTGPNGFSSFQQSPTINNVSSKSIGNYKVIVKNFASDDCSTAKTIEVGINPKPIGTASPNGITICSGGTMQLSTSFSVNSQCIYSAYGNSNSCLPINPCYNTYFGNNSSIMKTLSTPSALPPSLQFQIYWSGYNSNVTFNFYLNGNLIGSGTGNSSTYSCSEPTTNPSTFNISQSNYSDFWNSSGSNTFKITTFGGSINISAETVTMQGAPTISYQWSPSSGLSDANIYNPIATPSATTTYTVTATTNAGCQSTANTTISVLPSKTYYEDADGDGYGNASSTKDTCSQPIGYVTNFDDCNDNDANIHPGINTDLSPTPVLDLAFGNNGSVVFHHSDGPTFIASALQADGKILAYGYVRNLGLTRYGLIVRYNPDGSVDNSFGQNGVDSIDISAYMERTIAVQPDGKIVVCGTKYVTVGNSSVYRLFVERFLPDGSIDQSFGSLGTFSLAGGGTAVTANSLAIDASGKIVVGGIWNNKPFVFRLNSNGSIDNSFNGNGQVNLSTGIEITSVVIQPDGKIIASGTLNYYQPLVVRFNNDGTIDNSFNIAQGNYIPGYTLTSILQTDGKIILLTQDYDNSAITLSRFKSDGSLDNSFSGGTVYSDYNVFGNSISIQPDGKVLVGANDGTKFLVFRYNSDGSPDNSFADNGISRVNPECSSGAINALNLSSNHIYAVGYSSYHETTGVVLSYKYDWMLNCVANKTVNTEPDSCSAVVNNIDPKVAPFSLVNYNLSGSTTGSGNGTASGLRFNHGVTTVTYTATDDPSKSCSFTVTVVDNQLPELTVTATSSTDLGCNPDADQIEEALGTATATDNCGINEIVAEDSEVQSDGCTKWTTRTWTVSDVSGNTSSASRTITWTYDVTPPVITLSSTASTDLGCNPSTATIDEVLGEATALDNCDGELLPIASDEVSITGCTRSQTRTWTAIDACGNITTISRTVTWTRDQKLPSVSPTSTASTALGCNPTSEAIDAALGDATANDSCVGSLIPVASDGTVGSTGCSRSQTRTWTATDPCGNMGTASRTVTWTFDITTPVITPPSNVNTALGCNPSAATIDAALGEATAVDNCAGELIPTASDGPIGTTGNARSQTRTWTAIDGCGNIGTASRMVTWTSDVTAPVVTPNSTVTTALGCNPSGSTINNALGDATVVDNSFFGLTPTTSDSPVGTTGCARSQTRTWTAADGCGNVGTASRTVTWTSDFTSPVVTSTSLVTTALGCNPSAATIDAALGGAIATDNCSGALLPVASDGAIVTIGCARSQTRTWTAIDGCGNVGTASRMVTWTFDFTPPVVIASSTSTTALGCNPSAATIDAALGSATATDNCAGALLPIASDGVIGTTGCARSQTRVWTATDGCGNVGSTSRTVTWTSDITPPLITVTSTSTTALGCNPSAATISAALGGATATDNCSGAITPTASDSPIGTTGCSRSQTRTWTATDGCGNISTASRTVQWVFDITPPEFQQPASITKNADPGVCNASITINLPSVTDACSSVVIDSVRSDRLPLNASYPVGTTTITWKATDGCGNWSTINQTITVIDNQPPIITSCPTVPVQCYVSNNTYNVPVLTATDNCGVQSISYVVSGATSRSGNSGNASGTFNPGVSTITWTVTDVHANTSTCTTTVQIDKVDASIPDVWAANITATIGQPNTIYLGYGGTSVTLAGQITSSLSPGTYTYKWTIGAPSGTVVGTGPSVTVSPTATTVYYLSMKDQNGCKPLYQVTKHINVIDINCGGGKIYVCKYKNGSYTTNCIQPTTNTINNLPAGSYLGPCAAPTTVKEKNLVEAKFDELTVDAAPNPTNNSFTMIVNSDDTRTGVVLKVINVSGQTIEIKNNIIPGQSFKLGDGYARGIYFVEVKQGDLRKTLKLIKQ